MAKVVLVTGASSGLGKEIAQLLSKKGFRVFGTSRFPDKYPQAKYFPLLQMDVTQSNSIRQCVQEVLKEMGKIDVLINNAGAGIMGPIEEIDTDEVLLNFKTNCFGPVEVAKAVIPSMREQKSGLIVNITSIAGAMGLPFFGVYSASKGALELLTETLRMEVKKFKINVCSLAPGDYITNIASNRYRAPVIENSPYRKAYQKTLNTMDQAVEKGNNPIEVAQAVLKIINSKTPKVHYRVGAFEQRFSVVLKKILPDRMFEKIIMNHYKL